jgi:chromosome segregation ATPase
MSDDPTPMRRTPNRRATRSSPLSDTRDLEGGVSRLSLKAPRRPSIEEQLTLLERRVSEIAARMDQIISWDMENLSAKVEAEIRDAEKRLEDKFRDTVEKVEARDDQLDDIEKRYRDVYWESSDIQEKLVDLSRRVHNLEDLAERK